MPPALDSKQLQQDIDILERNIRELEGKYTDYFDSVISNEPKEMRAQTEAIVQRWWGKPISNTMLRFRMQNLIQRYKTFKEKWDRQLRVKKRADREDVLE